MPKEFACDGNDTPPPIQLSDPPERTKSYAVIMDDPDAPKGTFTHWLAYDMPAKGPELQVTDCPQFVPGGSRLAHQSG